MHILTTNKITAAVVFSTSALCAFLLVQAYDRHRELKRLSEIHPVKEEFLLSINLFKWLIEAPKLGYSAQEIRYYYEEQIKFIDQVIHSYT